MGEPSLPSKLKLAIFSPGTIRVVVWWNATRSYLTVHHIVVRGWRIEPPGPGPPAVFPVSAGAQSGGRPALHRLVSIAESRAFVGQERHSLVNVVLSQTERFPYHVGVGEAHAEERGDVLLLFGLHLLGEEGGGVSPAHRLTEAVCSVQRCACARRHVYSPLAAASLSRSSFPSTGAAPLGLPRKNDVHVGSGARTF